MKTATIAMLIITLLTPLPVCGMQEIPNGGQLIVLLDELDMIVVVTADPFYLQHDDESWKHERANINLVGKFIKSLPKR